MRLPRFTVVSRSFSRRRPVLAFVRLLPQADLRGTVGLALQILVSGLLPLLTMLAIGTLIGLLSGGSSTLPGISSPWQALGVIAGAAIALRVELPFLDPVTGRLAHRVDLLLRDRLMGGLLAPPTLAHLEDPGLADEVRLAQAVGTERFNSEQVVSALARIASPRLLATGSAVVLFGYRWWAPLLLLGAWAASNGWYRRVVVGLIDSLELSATGFRRAQYASDLALDGAAAKEIRIFDLGRWLTDRFDQHWQGGMRQAWSRRRDGWGMLGASGVLLASHAAALGALARSALEGDLGLGELVVHAQAVLGMAGFAWDADSQYVVRIGTAPIPHVLRTCDAVHAPRYRLPGFEPPPTPPRTGIRFHEASFAYPDSNQQVLRGLDLWVRAGQSLAIVGANGSGKTTLLKLLCRFYDPSFGRITVDGVDLRRLDPSSWQRRIAAVFQDFGRYPLPLRDNVSFGDLTRRDDDESLWEALEVAGARDLAHGLPAGLDTPLSRAFAGGVDPSGGQWQRVALARVLLALQAGADLLVLDEPTASLDVRAEADFYERFLRLTRGVTTIIVSHRFSTVRHADHIVVLDGGRIVESGSHEELLALQGRYAKMFALQAVQYLRSSDA